MKIKKTFQGELPENRVVNAKSNSATDAYSANYLNDKLNKVVVSPTEPTTGEDVWIKRSSNILKFDDFTETVNGITFTMKDQVLHVEGTATAYTQSCYITVDLTLEEAMTLTVDWDDDNLIPKAAYTYEGTSYYPNLYSQELEPGTYLNKLYFIIANGATVNTDVRFQLERGRGFSGWQPVMEKAILVKNDNGEYEDLIKKSVHVGVDESKNSEEVWLQRSDNLLDKNNPFIVYPFPDGTTKEWIFDTNGHSFVIEIESNTEYTITKPSDKNIFGLSTATSLPVTGGKVTNLVDGSSTEIHITSGANDKYLFGYFAWSSEKLDYATLLDGIQVQKGSVATPYQEYVDKKIYTKNDNGVYEEFYNEETIINSGVINGIHYIKFPDGTLIQRGNYNAPNINPNSGFYQKVNFPIPFIDDQYAVNITKCSGGSVLFSQVMDACWRTTNYIEFTNWNNDQNSAAYPIIYSWEAVGRWK